MDVTIPAGSLEAALALGERVASKASKHVNPSLAGTRCCTTELGDQLEFAATDLEMTVLSKATATIHKVGDAIIPTRPVLDLVRTLDEQPVRLQVDGHKIKLSARGFSAKLTSFGFEDYPTLPDALPDLLAVDPALLRRLIARVKFATSGKDVRFQLAGALMGVENQVLRFVATDGARMAVAEAPLPMVTGRPGVVWPQRFLDAAYVMLDGEQACLYGYSDAHLFLQVGSSTLIGRRLDGEFPKWQRSVPGENAVGPQVEITRDETLGMIRRALRVSDRDSRRITMALSKHALTISSASSEVGEAEETATVTYDGDPRSLDVNAGLVADFLGVVAAEHVTVLMAQPMRWREQHEGVTYTYVVPQMAPQGGAHEQPPAATKPAAAAAEPAAVAE